MKKLNGYRAAHRNHWILLEAGILTVQEKSFWDFCIDLADITPHSDRNGRFRFEVSAFSKLFRCSIGSIYAYRKKLVNLGLIEHTDERGIYSIPNFKRYVCAKGIYAGEAHEHAKEEKDAPYKLFQSITNNLLAIKEQFQSIEHNFEYAEELSAYFIWLLDSKGLSSSKSNLSLSIPPSQTLNHDHELKKYFDENPPALTPTNTFSILANPEEQNEPPF